MILDILMFIACNSSTESKIDPDRTVDRTVVDTAGAVVDEEIVGEGTLEPEDQENARHRMRMNVDQLKSSMTSITQVDWKDGNADLWDRYSTTLGVPDYLDNMTEDLTPSVIFQKFLNDAAVASCNDWIELDSTRTEKQFFVQVSHDNIDETDIRNNIEYLRYLIHCKRSLPEDPFVDSVWQLHSLVLQRTDDNIAAWNTVCVALFTHPEFYTF